MRALITCEIILLVISIVNGTLKTASRSRKLSDKAISSHSSELQATPLAPRPREGPPIVKSVRGKSRRRKSRSRGRRNSRAKTRNAIGSERTDRPDPGFAPRTIDYGTGGLNDRDDNFVPRTIDYGTGGLNNRDDNFVPRTIDYGTGGLNDRDDNFVPRTITHGTERLDDPDERFLPRTITHGTGRLDDPNERFLPRTITHGTERLDDPDEKFLPRTITHGTESLDDPDERFLPRTITHGTRRLDDSLHEFVPRTITYGTGQMSDFKKDYTSSEPSSSRSEEKIRTDVLDKDSYSQSSSKYGANYYDGLKEEARGFAMRPRVQQYDDADLSGSYPVKKPQDYSAENDELDIARRKALRGSNQNESPIEDTVRSYDRYLARATEQNRREIENSVNPQLPHATVSSTYQTGTPSKYDDKDKWAVVPYRGSLDSENSMEDDDYEFQAHSHGRPQFRGYLTHGAPPPLDESHDDRVMMRHSPLEANNLNSLPSAISGHPYVSSSPTSHDGEISSKTVNTLQNSGDDKADNGNNYGRELVPWNSNKQLVASSTFGTDYSSNPIVDDISTGKQSQRASYEIDGISSKISDMDSDSTGLPTYEEYKRVSSATAPILSSEYGDDASTLSESQDSSNSAYDSDEGDDDLDSVYSDSVDPSLNTPSKSDGRLGTPLSRFGDRAAIPPKGNVYTLPEKFSEAMRPIINNVINNDVPGDACGGDCCSPDCCEEGEDGEERENSGKTENSEVDLAATSSDTDDLSSELSEDSDDTSSLLGYAPASYRIDEDSEYSDASSDT